nr:MAG TPA: Putative apramycin biosynthetic oxidoreductase 4 SAM, FeS-cluster containing enzyme [Caudoviricetes sp.]
MRIALIDVDGHNFPNLPLMKLSAWHKHQEDNVEWYDPLTAWIDPPDKVYMSKVFTFTPDYPHPVCGGEIIRGGTGYHYPDGGDPLPKEIEHIYPDYSLYPDLCKDTAYGFLTRGCPRGCDFCIVAKKEGQCSVKVADLSEFWNGQKNIVLLDPNMFACRDWKDLSQQLINSGAWIDFSQGCDIRIMTEEKAEYIKKMKIKRVHFAWDRYEDKNMIIPKFKAFKEITGWDKRKLIVYVLTNFNTTHEQDLERIYTLRDLGYWPDVRIYEKHKLPKGHETLRLQRWVNMRAIFEKITKFEDYKP